MVKYPFEAFQYVNCAAQELTKPSTIGILGTSVIS